VPDIRCVGRLPPSEVHLPDELFSYTTTTDRSIHSRPHLFFLIHTSLLPWCCSSHPNGQQNCSISEHWPCPLRLLLHKAARAPVRGTRGEGASICNRSPRPGARRRRELLLPVAKGAAGEWELTGAVAPRGWVSSFRCPWPLAATVVVRRQRLSAR
jgi:hypothetical protein